MIMDNSKLRPHEAAKIVHSRYFTAVVRLAEERHVYGKHIEEHAGRTMSFKEKKGGGRGRERKKQEGRIVLYLNRSLILYIVPEKTKRAREREARTRTCNCRCIGTRRCSAMYLRVYIYVCTQGG